MQILFSAKRRASFLAPVVVTLLAAFTVPGTAEPQHAIAMQGEPALLANFERLPFVNPDAPQGGTMRYGVFGTFDNLNPVIVRGALTTARGIWFDKEFGNLVFEPMMQRSADEPFTMYGLLAETVETDAERSFVEFQLNPAAKFSDGEPVRPEDVLFTVEMLREHGRPMYANWLRPAVKIEKAGANGVRFTFDATADRETPLLISGLPVLPEHAFDRDTFERTTLEPVTGSGPYLIDKVEPGQRITYKKNPDYWGRDLPIKQGVDNYDTIVIEYFRDSNAQFEAFKKGLSYVYIEGDPNHWRTAYDFPAVTNGDVVKETFTSGAPSNMLAFVFNTRRPVFEDRAVRKALSMLFDFEWANRNLYYDAYKRTGSFFQNSELSSAGNPASEAEKALLADYANQIDPDVMDGTYAPPVTDGSGSDRKVLQAAAKAFQEAGYRFEGRSLVSPDGKPLSFEILVQSPEQERIGLAYKRTLDRIGVQTTIRQVDDAQYQARKSAYDFDMIIATYSASLSPGAEQVYRWGSISKDANGTFNFAGVADPALDKLINEIVSARSREAFVDAVRAYDRVLISGHYVVPLFHLPEQWLARWKFIEHPDTTPLYGYQLPTFWKAPDAK
ncbi:extracellular solute-binding protein [Aurantimonas sp. C2-6-R+9]|uniref:extracellular solute-binding protein n=1 Tax=unclassified Aurantimonas TaxID=2638230 RepID=UPI002E16C4F0|nr:MULTISPECIES: extracellular solute-binding protein [unclassified Aurantimonas]MEC5290226.1 extracellular solute-binding protein [Aurantimonas sp. C2-3-R2]MEC5380337.1 extracellular solute-binding protein [Aurantimonas sp. C2-6-R+9]MEC5411290.1 extracellular solute-binding protein [Aurantimonas sp. C2-4-R8]